MLCFKKLVASETLRVLSSSFLGTFALKGGRQQL